MELVHRNEKSLQYSIASVFAFRNDADRAFDLLGQVAERRDSGLTGLLVDPTFANLHSDPRWEPLLRTHGLALEQLAAIKFEVKLPQQ